jgi:hypothetical protein
VPARESWPVRGRQPSATALKRNSVWIDGSATLMPIVMNAVVQADRELTSSTWPGLADSADRTSRKLTGQV